MTPQWDDTDLDAEFVFDRFLDGGDHLDVLQRVLAATAPVWSAGLHVVRPTEEPVPVDVNERGALAAAVLTAIHEPGPVERALVDVYGSAPREPFVGTVELGGGDPGLAVTVALDQQSVRWDGPTCHLGNTIRMEVRRPRVQGISSTRWLREATQSLCQALSPAWASARHPGEHWAKVMSDGPRVEELGRDFGRYLPGVFWLNFFGPPYRDLVGVTRLRAAPGRWIAMVGGGAVVEVDSNPRAWDTPSYAVAEQRIRDHLGPNLFFSKGEPSRKGRAPDWN